MVNDVLHAFIEAIDAGSFSKATEKFYLAQEPDILSKEDSSF